MEGEEAFKQLLEKLEDYIETSTRRQMRIDAVESRNRELSSEINKKDKEIAQLHMQLDSEERKHNNLQSQLIIMQNKVEALLEQINPAEEDEIDKPAVLEILNGN